MRPDERASRDAVRTCIAQGECRPRHHASKNTRDWCGGKEGRLLHVYVWLDDAALKRLPRIVAPYGRGHYGDGLGYTYEIRACLQCGRIGWPGRRSRTRCHCGILLVRDRPTRYASKWCEACGYRPYQAQRYVGGVWVPPRQPCRCELVTPVRRTA